MHKHYHDKYYGFPIHDDNELFGRLIMEINQAGLSWEIILRKEESFRKAYRNFIVGLQNEFGSFENWYEHHQPKTKEEWVKLFKKNIQVYRWGNCW